MTRDELTALGRRLYASAYRIIVGPTVSKGGNVSEVTPETDPRDARIAELEAELAAAHQAPAGNQAPAGTSTDTTGATTADDEPSAPAEVTYEEAKAKVDANEELTDADVTALERGPAK